MVVKRTPDSPPVVAISAVPRSLDTGYGIDLGDTVAAGLVQGVLSAGGVPVMLPVVGAKEARVQIAPFDALVLAGGQDLALELDARQLALQPQKRWIDPKRDEHELALWDEAKKRLLPVFGICRGAQLINFAQNGPLIAHIDGHDANLQHRTATHGVAIAPGSRLAGIIASRSLDVNTIHHQALEAPGDHLRAVAESPDGVIEAIESTVPEHWMVSVQWHPELMLDRPGGQDLFDAVVREASARRT